jgi:outer membrane protein
MILDLSSGQREASDCSMANSLPRLFLQARTNSSMRKIFLIGSVAIGFTVSAFSPASAEAPARRVVPQQVTLAQAVAIAAAQSPVLQAARDDYRLAQIQVDLQRVPFSPSVVGSVTVQRTQPAFLAATTNTLQGELQQLLYDGGVVLARVRSAQFSQDAAASNFRRATQLLTFTVAQAYYNALEARANVELARQIVKQNETQEALIRTQIQAGTASRLDQATAHLPTSQALVQLALAQGQESSTLATFDNVLGLRADVGAEPIDDPAASSPELLIPSKSLDVAASIARALALRPDYLAGERSVDAARQSLRAAQLGRAPQFFVNAIGGAESRLPNGFGLSAVSTIGASINVPIFDQGLARAQTAQAAVQLDSFRAVCRETELAVELDVRQALSTLVSARTALAEAQAELSGAQTVLRGTQEQYRAGVTTLPLLLNAQAALTQAETVRLSAVYALRQAEQAYLLAVGDAT